MKELNKKVRRGIHFNSMPVSAVPIVDLAVLSKIPLKRDKSIKPKIPDSLIKTNFHDQYEFFLQYTK